jgi:hypothetical protein
MRTFLYTVLGAVVGFTLGALAPVVVYLIMEKINPEMRQGGGTPFALMIILTAPVGAFYGAGYGYARSNSPGE